MTSAERRWSASSLSPRSFKFPDYDPASPFPRHHETIFEEDSEPSPINLPKRTISYENANGSAQPDRWGSRANGHVGGRRGHTRQKSLSDAIRTINSRRGSVSANAAEIADALKAPVSYTLVSLCIVWYLSSALTNTSSKSILNAYPKPITLTIVQFAFVSLWCWVFARLARMYPPLRARIPALKDGLRPPTRYVITTTLPLAVFQLGGHVLSSSATQHIPVSLVHTIKGLSPLFTVLAYRTIFRIKYTRETYLSLVPLTLGVVMACSVEFSGNVYGILCAFTAAVIFVAQNIFSKKLFNDAARAEADALPHSQMHPKKLDKLNLLFYCSTSALILTFPLWLWTEGFAILADVYADGKIDLSNKPAALDHGPLALEFLFNGVFHFGQNIIAFVLLSMVSPVTYSVASLIKRVFVIVVAILWFRSPTTNIQAFGIALTFFGLYLYDRTHDSARSAKRVHKSHDDAPLLPLNTRTRHGSSTVFESPAPVNQRIGFPMPMNSVNAESKKLDADGPGVPVAGLRPDWLPGTRQEDTWKT